MHWIKTSWFSSQEMRKKVTDGRLPCDSFIFIFRPSDENLWPKQGRHSGFERLGQVPVPSISNIIWETSPVIVDLINTSFSQSGSWLWRKTSFCSSGLMYVCFFKPYISQENVRLYHCKVSLWSISYKATSQEERKKDFDKIFNHYDVVSMLLNSLVLTPSLCSDPFNLFDLEYISKEIYF